MDIIAGPPRGGGGGGGGGGVTLNMTGYAAHLKKKHRKGVSGEYSPQILEGM